MDWDFSAPIIGRRIRLHDVWPYIHPTIRERIKASLDAPHWCRSTDPITAQFTRRITNGMAIWLQCTKCGRSIGSPMSKDHHPQWETYPEWNSELNAAYQQAEQDHQASLPTSEDLRIQREEEYRQRSIEYEHFLRRSPEWAEIKKKIIWRSRGYCEACLVASAQVVHHLTYEFGKLPPAWQLRAVCDPCHARLHAQGDDWCAFGMSR